MKINFKQANSKNYKQGRSKQPEYIVIHYTANQGDTAKNNADYFAREDVGASANYFVDETEIWQSVADTDTAWHCGGSRQSSKGGTFYGKCQNSNSIGVEICMNDKSGAVRQGSIKAAAELVRYLMQRYGVPVDRVIRHYDVTGKYCPGPMVDDPALWAAFKQSLTQTEDDSVRYKYYDDMPDWAKPTVSKLVKKGYLKGEGGGVLNLTEDTLKVLVVNDRAGCYGE